MPVGNPEDRGVLSRLAPEPDRQWTYGADPDQCADVYAPGAAPRSTVVLIHGGFWRPEYDRAHVRPMARALAARGHLVVSLDYRRRPGDPDITVDDIRLAVAEIARAPWLPDAPLQVIGHSAGGHLALLVAANPPVDLSVVALAPVADLAEAARLGLDTDAVIAFLGADPSERPDLDPTAEAGPRIPVTVVHGENDSIVPVSLSRSYARAHADSGWVSLLVLQRTAHFEVIDPLAPAFGEWLSVLDPSGIE